MNETEEKKIEKEESTTEKVEEVHKTTSFEELNKKLEEYERELKDLKDKYLRALADQDNLRKRMEKEKAELFNFGLTNFIKELLPVVDSLESALIEAQKSGNNSAGITEGIQLILTKFHATLKKHGVKEIEALNKPFDPTFHEAIGKEERNDVEPMTIVAEMEKGYTLKGRILRPAKVIVAVGSTPEKESSESGNPENKEQEVNNG